MRKHPLAVQRFARGQFSSSGARVRTWVWMRLSREGQHKLARPTATQFGAPALKTQHVIAVRPHTAAVLDPRFPLLTVRAQFRDSPPPARHGSVPLGPH
jgi:hypothetical protein